MPLVLVIILGLLLILLTYLYFERRIRHLDEKIKTGPIAYQHKEYNSPSKTHNS